MSQPTMDEKPLESLFDFDQFPENNTISGLVDHSDFFHQNVFDDAHTANPYGLSDQFSARHFDLQTDSGATLVSDGSLAAEV